MCRFAPQNLRALLFGRFWWPVFHSGKPSHSFPMFVSRVGPLFSPREFLNFPQSTTRQNDQTPAILRFCPSISVLGSGISTLCFPSTKRSEPRTQDGSLSGNIFTPFPTLVFFVTFVASSAFCFLYLATNFLAFFARGSLRPILHVEFQSAPFLYVPPSRNALNIGGSVFCCPLPPRFFACYCIHVILGVCEGV